MIYFFPNHILATLILQVMDLETQLFREGFSMPFSSLIVLLISLYVCWISVSYRIKGLLGELYENM